MRRPPKIHIAVLNPASLESEIESERHRSQKLRQLALEMGMEISISHSRGTVVGLYSERRSNELTNVQHSAECRWGIDIEQQDRVLSPRLLERLAAWPSLQRPDSLSPLAEWVVREACYKADSSPSEDRHVGIYKLIWETSIAGKAYGAASEAIYFRLFEKHWNEKWWWVAVAQTTRPFLENELFFLEPCTTIRGITSTISTAIPTLTR